MRGQSLSFDNEKYYIPMALKNFSWIIPDTLAGSALPGGAMYLNDEYALSDLRELYELGVRRLISL
ncbi:MAG: hypothetical protein GF401_02710, partial [Chitinivibrionales bacterium]|nr:hypothetical protein [Chitinivibrionales bacterium]